MNIFHPSQARSKFLFLLSLFIVASNSQGQSGLQTTLYNFDSISDSTNFNFPIPVLPLRNWYDITDQYFELGYESNKLDIYQYISPSNIILKDPFKLDVRGSSYYIPRMVRDELNLIMNRPKDSNFVPILPAAYLALQLASKYLLIQMKTEISWKDIENSRDGRAILEELWQKNPQTISELYKRENLKNNYTMMELQRLTELLCDNKLLKRKLIENSETQYFYALEKIQYLQLIEKGKAEKFNFYPPSNTPAPDLSP